MIEEKTIPTREKEIRRLALDFSTYLDPEDLLEPNDFPPEIDKSNGKFGYGILPQEVAEAMILWEDECSRKEKLRRQISARNEGIKRPLTEVPYRDWLVGMIYAQAMGQLSFANAIKHADNLIAELYPIEGEL